MAPSAGVLLIYAHYGQPYASTVVEHVDGIARYLGPRVERVNASLGFPRTLRNYEFDVLLLHYSLFGAIPYALDDGFLEFLSESGAFKVAFFQDEYRFVAERQALMREVGVDLIFTLVTEEHHPVIYPDHHASGNVVYCLPGYVGPKLIRGAKRFSRSDSDRTVDLFYRARSVPYYLGRAGQNKTEVAAAFQFATPAMGLQSDISADPRDRIYGKSWHMALGNARCVLGVEGGASVFDLDGEVKREHDVVMASDPSMSFDDYAARSPVRESREYRHPYLMITPRNFEAAAFRSCQVLLEGEYSGILEPGVDYVPVRRDFSNVDEVLEMIKDGLHRRELAERAHQRLIGSGEFHYERFGRQVADRLREAGALAAKPRLPRRRVRLSAAQWRRRGHRWWMRKRQAMRSTG